AASSLLSILPLYWYPITEQGHAEVLQRLQARRID
ncbi:MAG: hypothetical protein ACI8W3_003616, partial [Myxococcota bacterium]